MDDHSGPPAGRAFNHPQDRRPNYSSRQPAADTDASRDSAQPERSQSRAGQVGGVDQVPGPLAPKGNIDGSNCQAQNEQAERKKEAVHPLDHAIEDSLIDSPLRNDLVRVVKDLKRRSEDVWD